MASVVKARTELRKAALSLPDAWADHPWGEDVAKVGKRVFVFLGRADRKDLFVGVKLGASWGFAKTRPFVKEMGYGLGRSGWVEARLEKGDVPVDLLRDWILESYELVAPKPTGRAAADAKGSARPRSRTPSPSRMKV